MFEHLASFRIVLVTGPQRSGTRICAQMIAHDTPLRYVDELAFDVHDKARWLDLVCDGAGLVIQCPTMCRYVAEVGHAADVAVVLLRRDLADILASQEWIGWRACDKQRELARYGLWDGEPAVVKYAAWAWQRAVLAHPFEVEYESLASHPLWVPKEQRSGFAWNQTEVRNGL